jgi:hypothetical protein
MKPSEGRRIDFGDLTGYEPVKRGSRRLNMKSALAVKAEKFRKELIVLQISGGISADH